jgi:hypothetical protein
VRLDHADHGILSIDQEREIIKTYHFDDKKSTYIIARPRVAAMGSTGSCGSKYTVTNGSGSSTSSPLGRNKFARIFLTILIVN